MANPTAGRKAAEDRITIREIKPSDLEMGLLEVLTDLTEVGDLKPGAAKKILSRIASNPLHKIFVAVDSKGKVVGTTTLLVEPKFIHEGGKVGHIEDVVVRKSYQGRDIGQMLVRAAIEHARKLHCYKCILDCEEAVAGFYERLGFRRYELEMRMDLKY